MKKILAILLMTVFMAVVLLAGCSSNNSNNTSANTCGENISMLQTAVDKYKNDVSVFPVKLEQLLNDSVANWKGPYISEIPRCPAGGIYRVDGNGRVTE